MICAWPTRFVRHTGWQYLPILAIAEKVQKGNNVFSLWA